MTVDDETQVKNGVSRLNQGVANQKWLTLNQIPALRRRGIEKDGLPTFAITLLLVNQSSAIWKNSETL